MPISDMSDVTVTTLPLGSAADIPAKNAGTSMDALNAQTRMDTVRIVTLCFMMILP
jgi:hypothetical protein